MPNFGEGLGTSVMLGSPVGTPGLTTDPGPITVATAQDSNWWDNLKNKMADMQGGNILGMSPDSFSAVAGGMGTAVSNPKSWQARLGTLASQMGQAKIAGLAAQNQEKANQAFLLDAIKKGLINPAEVLTDYKPSTLQTATGATGVTAPVAANPTLDYQGLQIDKNFAKG